MELIVIFRLVRNTESNQIVDGGANLDHTVLVTSLPNQEGVFGLATREDYSVSQLPVPNDKEKTITTIHYRVTCKEIGLRKAEVVLVSAGHNEKLSFYEARRV